MKHHYQEHAAALLRGAPGPISVDPLATVLVYALMIVGLLVLAVKPSESFAQALGLGATAGLFAYGTFALTNQAILANWPWTLTLADMAWGTF